MKLNPSILVVDDQQSVRFALRSAFKSEDYNVRDACDGEEALEKIRSSRPDVVILDLKLPRMNGIDVLREAKTLDSSIRFIIITAFPGVDTAVDAMKMGASDYITKPFDLNDIVEKVNTVTKNQRLDLSAMAQRAQDEKRAGVPAERAGCFMVYKDPVMNGFMDKLTRAARSKASGILIQGESGTGKGLASRVIHSLSSRSCAPFVEVNCTALNAQLIESELFGHEKGAFTDAKCFKPGLFELAHSGTLFLDEIGDMDISLQSKLLKALEDKKIRRVGGVKDIEVDVRVIASTNKDLQAMVKTGAFREDLYFRLNVIPLSVPSLRERRKDIEALAVHYADQLSDAYGMRRVKISGQALKLLTKYDWPGNVRELKNELERIFVLEPLDGVIEEEHVSFSAGFSRAKAPSDEVLTLDDTESMAIREALKSTNGNIQKTARMLNINRTTLYNKIRKYKIDV